MDVWTGPTNYSGKRLPFRSRETESDDALRIKMPGQVCHVCAISMTRATTSTASVPGAVYSDASTTSNGSVYVVSSGWPLFPGQITSCLTAPTHPVIRMTLIFNRNRPTCRTDTSGKAKYTPDAPARSSISDGVATSVPYSIETSSPSGDCIIVAS